MQQLDEFTMFGLRLPLGEIGTFAAGFFGSVVSMRFIGPLPWYERLFLVAGGTLASHYLTPLVGHYLGFTTQPPSVAFLVGLFSMSVIRTAQKFLHDIGANPIAILKFFLKRD